ncbi:MAG TPA: CCA tRNA nucleotidyltransferase [Acidobacteriaceae bacterium]|jgi:tRNA nucleotidyltransferase/poly(A) polymerase|nr:CCA tRNA nucleotidyltransferase [Acidobacteriaceae bacterium]
MADYIYLLETRLSPAQREALKHVRDVARAKGMTVFLVGGAVRDLTNGTAIRDLDVSIQGNALKLKRDLEKAGGRVVGSNEPFQSLYLTFPSGVRVEVGSTLAVSYPKPGKPVTKPAGILDDLRSRDFTANAMAISLNEGSYGLLMDPLNGVADIENRELRLVSNYGFIEDPARMIRGARLSARFGWTMEERTQQRYDTGKAEGYISALRPWEKSYELEEIFHEEDPLRIQRRLEAEGWSKVLFPGWTAAKANENEIEKLRDTAGQLNVMGIYADSSAALFPLLTAKLGGKETTALKKAFARPGFVEEIESIEKRTKEFAAQFTSKANAAPSDAWKMIYAADPEAVLALAYGSKVAAVQQKFKLFFSEWPQARVKIPYPLMQEMRITPEIAGYNELLEKLFFAIMDAKLETPELQRAFLEPYSPPAPPPPPNLRRRPAKRESKAAKKAPKAAAAAAAGAETVQIAASAGGAKPGAKAAAGQKQAPGAVPAAGTKKAAVAAPVKGAAKPVAPSAAKAAKTPVKKAVKAVVKAKPKAPAKKAARPMAKTAAKRKPVVAKAAAKKVKPKVPARRPASAKHAAKKAAPAKKKAAGKSSKKGSRR